MSAAAPTANAGDAVPAKKGKKKLIVIAAAALLLLAVASGAAVFLMKKKAAQNAADGDEPVAAAAAEHHADKPDLKHPPTFLPLDPFVVNLADREVDRYAQVGITFEVEDPKFADQMKAFMPAFRNGILMILSHKASADLIDRPGKELLAAEILSESARTMGIEVDEPEAPVASKKPEGEKAVDEEPKPKKKAMKKAAEPNPIKRVHFSNFIVQ